MATAQNHSAILNIKAPSIQRFTLTLLVALLTSAALTNCGQTGPLTLPQQQAKPAAAEKSAKSATPSSEELNKERNKALL